MNLTPLQPSDRLLRRAADKGSPDQGNLCREQPDGEDGLPYHHPGRFIREHFGERLFRVSVDAGFSCPNRDGSIGTGGCLFCDIDGFRPFAARSEHSIAEQVRDALPDCRRRHPKATGYLIYLQPFTNTYCTPHHLKAVIDEALACPGMRGLIIATRPDCLPPEISDQLQAANKRTFLQVELGVQSTDDSALFAMKRGHTWADSARAITGLRRRGIRTTAHLILGTPWESPDSQIRGASIISDYGVSAVKLHHLQILAGSQLASLDQSICERLPSHEEYINIVIEFLSHLDRGIVVERLMAEAPPRLLIAPRWGFRSRDLRRKIIAAMIERKRFQGCLYQPSCGISK